MSLSQPIPTSFVEYEGSCFYEFHRTAQSHAEVTEIIKKFIDSIIESPGAPIGAISIPSSAPVIAELGDIRQTTDKHWALEYIYQMARLGYPVMGEITLHNWRFSMLPNARFQRLKALKNSSISTLSA